MLCYNTPIQKAREDMAIQVLKNFGDETLMDVSSLEFLNIGDKVINQNGEWVVEGKVVEVTETIKVLGIFNKKEKVGKEYKNRYILRLVK